MATQGLNSVKGTRAKSRLYMKPIGNYHLADIDFEVTVSTNRGFKSYTLKKADCKQEDRDSYIVPVDSSILGAGVYYGTVTLRIPDVDFPDGVRIEKVTSEMDIIIEAR